MASFNHASVTSRGLSDTQKSATPSQPAYNTERPARSSSTSASLYVGELDLNVQEPDLYDIFNAFGPIDSIRVCRDASSQRSLGYAFVNLKHQADGERAIAALDGTSINGKPCRIMWSQRDLAKRRLAGGNIFVKNLDPAMDEELLRETFGKFGTILSCKVVMDAEGLSKGYGFVHFDSIEAAENAIKHVNGTTLNDRELFVGHHIPKRERQQQQQQHHHHHHHQQLQQQQQQQQQQQALPPLAQKRPNDRFTNVYVKNLMQDIKEEELKELFAGFGPIASVLIQRDENGQSKGFGFVNFERHEDAEQAVKQMNDKEYIGRRLFVSRAQKKSERQDLNRYYQGTNLYIKNLDDTINDQRLRDEFTKFGAISSARVMRDERTDVSKGFGFVCFSSPQEATKAVAEMNGRMIGSKAVYVALAHRRQRNNNPQQQQQHHPHHQYQQYQQPYPPYGVVYYDYPGYPSPDMSPFYMKPPYSVPYPVNYIPGPVYPSAPSPASGAAATATATAATTTAEATTTATNATESAVPPAVQNQEITMEMIASQPPEVQSQMLGERIFAIVEKYPEEAGKVTGMLLEMDYEDLVVLINKPEALEIKADEAIAVLLQHQSA